VSVFGIGETRENNVSIVISVIIPRHFEEFDSLLVKQQAPFDFI
jgi:hypothetical protein